MASSPKLNLDDAEACLARARKHYADLKDLTDPGALWRMSEGHDIETSKWFNCLHLDRARLVAAKPVLADSANNVWSALDHIAAALARANGRARADNKRLHFPRGLTDDEFNRALEQVEPDLGGKMLRVLADARAKHQHDVHHAEAARQISNSGKHWELKLASGDALAVMLVLPGQRARTFELPRDAFAINDTFEFYRGAERLPTGVKRIVINLLVAGLDDSLPNAIDSILECSFRFVRAVIDSVVEAGNEQTSLTA